MTYKTFILNDNHHYGNGFLYLNFHIFNEEKYFSIQHSNTNMSFFFSFKEENIPEDQFETFSDIFNSYVNKFNLLSIKLLKLDQSFKNKNLDLSSFNSFEFEDLFKHSIYSNSLFTYLDLYKVDEQHISKLFYLLCNNKYAFKYIFIYYFCEEYFFNIFEPNITNKDNFSFFDFIFEKLQDHTIKDLTYLLSDSSIVYFEFFHSIYSYGLSFEAIASNMLSKNIEFTQQYKDFFYIYLPADFYQIALPAMQLDRLQKFTFDYNIILDEYNTNDLEIFLSSISNIQIGDYLFKNNKNIQEYLLFLNTCIELIENAYDDDYCLQNILLFQQFFYSVISTLNEDDIIQLTFTNSKLLSLLHEQYLLKLKIDKF